MASSALDVAVAQVVVWHSRQQQRLIIVGISGPQGSGKSTLANSLVTKLQQDHAIRSATLSIDDLYLTHDDQGRVAERGNPLTTFRGNPGTHDLPFGSALLDSMLRENANAKESGSRFFRLPRYDKSAFGGRGDRMAEVEWQPVELPIDVLFFEGWCVGFRAVSDQEVAGDVECSPSESPLRLYPLENIVEVMRNLRIMEDSWWPYLDFVIQLEAEDIKEVYEWRGQAEDMLRLSKGEQNAMTKDQVRDYVDRFMPTYLLCLPRLRSRGGFFRDIPSREGCFLRIKIGKQRQVLESTLQ